MHKVCRLKYLYILFLYYNLFSFFLQVSCGSEHNLAVTGKSCTGNCSETPVAEMEKTLGGAKPGGMYVCVMGELWEMEVCG